MILDGYNRRAVISLGQRDVRVIYRPFHQSSAPERERLRWEISFLGEQAAQREIDRMLFARIVQWDLPLEIAQIDLIRQANEAVYNQLLRLLFGLVVDASGEKWRDVESAWATNLREGVILDLTDTKLASRSCTDCQKYWYQSNGLVLIRNSTGEKELRPEFALPSCRTEFGCPKGTPENQKSLNVSNEWAWRHFRQCEVLGQFPDDDIVRYNTRVIRQAIQKAEQIRKETRDPAAIFAIGSGGRNGQTEWQGQIR